MRNFQKIDEIINEAVEFFVNEEIEQIKAVAKRLSLSVGSFISQNYSLGVYNYIEVNGDKSYIFLRNHVEKENFQKMNDKHFDKFIRLVNKEMNQHFRLYCNIDQCA